MAVRKAQYIIPDTGYVLYPESFKERIANDEELAKREWYLCKYNREHFWRNFVYIVNKKAERILFNPNAVQQDYLKKETNSDIILKSRRLGFSTLKVLEALHGRLFFKYTSGAMMAHDGITNQVLYDIWKFAYANLPEFLKAKTDIFSAHRTMFSEDPFGRPLRTSYSIFTAGSREVGRGGTLSELHLSEFGLYPNALSIWAGCRQALTPTGKISIESTAQGYNTFYEFWKHAISGESTLKPHFYPWWKDPECVMKPWVNMVENLGDVDKEYFKALKVNKHQISFYLTRRDKDRLGSDLMHQEYPSTSDEAFVASSSGVFDGDLLTKLDIELSERKAQAGFVAETREDGNIIIWQKPKPEHRYVAGVDCSKGIAGGDYSVMVVLDNHTGEQVAELHGRYPTDIFAHKVDELGRYYNDAIINVENDKYGTAVLLMLRTGLHYPALFFGRRWDAKSRMAIRELGFTPTSKSKTQIITQLQEALRTGDVTVNSTLALMEMRYYVHITPRTMGAEPSHAEGEHKRDDRVIAIALAAHVLLKMPWTPTVDSPQEDEEYSTRLFRLGRMKLKQRLAKEAVAHNNANQHVWRDMVEVLNQ